MATISHTVLGCWKAILRALPSSRLALKNPWLGKSSQQARVRTALGAAGVAPNRANLLGHSDRIPHFAAYEMIDIALDSLLHGGGMTTLDELWVECPSSAPRDHGCPV